MSAQEMREVDRLTTEKYGIPSLLLMENAAHAAARVIAERLEGPLAERSVLILCGTGNNGGDGAALARVLWQDGADVEVVLFGKAEDTDGDARVNFEILRRISDGEGFEMDQADLSFEEITSLEEWLEYDSLNFHADDPDVLVDAMFGTGLSRPLEEIHQQAAAYIDAYCEHDCGTLVVALDIPSGIDGDRCERIGINPRVHLTVSFTAPKLANVLPPAANCSGDVVVVNIGTPAVLVHDAASETYVAEAEDVRHWMAFTEFSPGSYKRKRGHALLIAGAENYAGAAVMCGNAAIRTGAGVVTLAVPESSQTAIAARVSPEVMVRGVAETGKKAVSEKAFAEIEEFWERADAVAIGSGLSETDPSTRKLVKKVFEKRRTPLVIDADGLNLLSPFKLKGDDLLPVIMTPHEGEFLRLLGEKDGSAIADRVAAARDFAKRHNVILLLKGERNLISAPDGRVVINPTGNSGLGKAGNGDTLTGIVTGFVAQAVKLNVDIFETVVAAAYVAGLAGDIAEETFGKRIMTASDVAGCLGDAFELIENEL